MRAFIAGLAVAVCLSAFAYVTYPVPVKQGGTGAATLSANGFLHGSGTSPVGAWSNLSWDNSNFRLGIGATPPLLEKKSANSLYIKKSDATQSYPVVVSPEPSTNGLLLIRGGSTTNPSGGSCGTAIGEGYSCARTGTGAVTVTFTTAFATTPSCVCQNVLGTCVTTMSTTTAAMTISVGGSPFDTVFNFICLGERPT